jgi:hypothetical protein
MNHYDNNFNIPSAIMFMMASQQLGLIDKPTYYLEDKDESIETRDVTPKKGQLVIENKMDNSIDVEDAEYEYLCEEKIKYNKKIKDNDEFMFILEGLGYINHSFVKTNEILSFFKSNCTLVLTVDKVLYHSLGDNDIIYINKKQFERHYQRILDSKGYKTILKIVCTTEKLDSFKCVELDERYPNEDLYKFIKRWEYDNISYEYR